MTELAYKRNFAIIAHIDHGKSTLADRLIEVCGGLSNREMKEQVLDSMDIERERGITIKAQTVRLTYKSKDGDSYELNLIDTPGHVDFSYEVSRSLAACEGSLLVVDATQGVEAQTLANAYLAIDANHEMVPVLNKIDLIQRSKLLQLISHLDGEELFQDICMISALNGDGVKHFLDKLKTEAPLGPWLYPEDQVSDVPLRMLASEMTREKLFLQLQNELPYSSSVLTEQWRERKDGSVRIDQVIYVERQSQKIIVVGKNGKRVKSIGTAARRDLEDFLERPVHLFLHVKVRHDWSERAEHYQELGLDFNV